MKNLLNSITKTHGQSIAGMRLYLSDTSSPKGFAHGRKLESWEHQFPEDLIFSSHLQRASLNEKPSLSSRSHPKKSVAVVTLIVDFNGYRGSADFSADWARLIKLVVTKI